MNDSQLWAVRIIGPDDMLACASRDDAIRNATWINMGSIAFDLVDFPAEFMWAVPTPWEGGADSHARNLAEQVRLDPRWAGGRQPLAELSAIVFRRKGEPSD